MSKLYSFSSKTDDLSPIVLFTYRRVDKLKTTIESLLSCKLAGDSTLYIYSDGAKGDADIAQVNKVRGYIRNVSGFKKIILHFSDKNYGLAHSVINGVSNVLEAHESIIVLEDDLVFTPNFLQFMNLSLQQYSSNKEVFSISGYSFNLKPPKNYTKDCYFLNRGWSWGWATWRDRWLGIDWDVKDYASFVNNRAARREFAKGGSDLNIMLKRQLSGNLDSWAIRWFYHQYKVKGLTLYPLLSKVDNNGFDELSTHTKGSNKRFVPTLDRIYSESFDFPDLIENEPYFQKIFLKKVGIPARIKSKIDGFLHNLINLKKK